MSLRLDGIYDLRDPYSADEFLVAYTVESSIGRLQFRAKFPGSMSRDLAEASARRQIAAVCRQIAQDADATPALQLLAS